MLNMIILAGHESGAGNPLIRDFLLRSQKLAKLGFVYHRDSVIVVQSLVEDTLSDSFNKLYL